MSEARKWRLPIAALSCALLFALIAGCGQINSTNSAAPVEATITVTQSEVAVEEASTTAEPVATTATATIPLPGMPACSEPPPDEVAGPMAEPAQATVPNRATPEAQPAIVTQATQVTQSAGRIVALDPGHGGKETGAESARGLIEKNVNLEIGLKLADLLRTNGYVPVLTRNSDIGVNVGGKDLNGNGVVDNDDDLQARVDIANAARADLLISLHNDSTNDPATNGTTVYYCETRPFAAENRRLTSTLEEHLVASIRAAGYNTANKGISDDAPLRKPYGHLFVLGPLTPRVARASNMPGALGETLYLSNPTEASLLANDSVLSAIARGYYDGIQAYFAGQ